MYRRVFFFLIFFLLKSVSAFAVVYVFPQDLQKVLQLIEQEPMRVIIAAMKVHTETKYQNSAEYLYLCAQRNKQNRETIVLTESRLSSQETRPAHVDAMAPLEVLKKTGAQVVTNSNQFSGIQTKVISSENFLLMGTGHDSPIPADPRQRIHERDFALMFLKKEYPELVAQAYGVFLAIAENRLVDPASLNFELAQLELGKAKLSWGPWHHQDNIIQMIAQAQKTIDIYQQDLQDTAICDALKAKAAIGIQIRILMSQVPFRTPENLAHKINKSRSNLGSLQKHAPQNVQVKLVGAPPSDPNQYPLHIHAKILIIDGEEKDCWMYLGSANFFPGVLDPKGNNLNVGVIMRATPDIQGVLKQFNQDWQEGK